MHERFWEKVDVRGEDECWPWNAALRGDYGRIWCPEERRVVQATYYLFRHVLGHEGIMPGKTGTIFRHSCDNPPCCNPKHITPGTQSENAADKVAKGRHHYQRETCKRGHSRWSVRIDPNGGAHRRCLDCRKIYG